MATNERHTGIFDTAVSQRTHTAVRCAFLCVLVQTKLDAGEYHYNRVRKTAVKQQDGRMDPLTVRNVNIGARWISHVHGKEQSAFNINLGNRSNRECIIFSKHERMWALYART